LHKPEQRLNILVKNQYRKRLLMKRIEHALEAGWPDLLVLSKRTRRVTFVECKVAHWPQRPNGRIQFNHTPTIDQINWHLEWTNNGGSSFYLIRIVRQLFAVPGDIGDKVVALTQATIAPFEVDWASLLKLYEEGTT
jgi:hypothetical protein